VGGGGGGRMVSATIMELAIQFIFHIKRSLLLLSKTFPFSYPPPILCDPPPPPPRLAPPFTSL